MQVLLNSLHLQFWAKATVPLGVSATIVDASEHFEWLGFWQTFNLTTVWQRFEAIVALDTSARTRHQLQASLVLGRGVGTYHVDQLTLSQGCSNWPEPWVPAAARPRLVSGFEDCHGALPQVDARA